MGRRNSSNVMRKGRLVEKSERANIVWFAFPLIGYLLVFFLVWLGASLISNNIIIGAVGALLICAAFYFVTDFLEKAKTEDKSQIPFWIIFALLGIISSCIGYHYLHIFHNSDSSFMATERKKIEAKVSLFNSYENFTNGFSTLGNCNMQPLSMVEDMVKTERIYYNSKLANLNNPFKYLVSIGKSSNDKSYATLKSTMETSIQNYNLVNEGTCKYTQGLVGIKSSPAEINVANDIGDSMSNANWIWYLGLLIISSFLLLVPYFIAPSPVVILERRK